MERLLTEISGYSISDDLQSYCMSSPVIGFPSKKDNKPKTLSSCVHYFSKINDVEQDLTGICFGFDNVILNDELSDKKVRKIAQELAEAIDSNSVQRVKDLKQKYGNDKEFLKAKKFLEQKCKEVWNVFDSHDLKVPQEALKTLGITNRPTLEFLLGDSVRFYEKDGGSSTADIIASVLKNKNINYKISDIHKFLKTAHDKEKCEYNFKTVAYLISQQNYDEAQLLDLGVQKETVNKVLKTLSFKEKARYIFRKVRFLV